MNQRIGAFSLIELLSVIAIIVILSSLLLPTLGRAHRRAKAMSEEVEGSEVADRLRDKVRRFCAANTVYRFDTKLDLNEKCRLDPKCRQWVDASRTVFVPFNNLDSTNKVVITFHYGRNYALSETFTKGDLTDPPQ